MSLWTAKRDRQKEQARMLLRECGRMGVRVTNAHDREAKMILLTGKPFTDAAITRMRLVAAPEGDASNLTIQVGQLYEASDDSNEVLLACLELMVNQLKEAGL